MRMAGTTRNSGHPLVVMLRPVSNRRREGGAVFVEFLLVFPPLFVLFLVILQWSLLSATSLGVKHAAASAARSAIVVLPDDPVAYEGAPQFHVPVDGTCSDGFLGKFGRLVSKVGITTNTTPKDRACPGGPRMDAIRFAAIMRMIPFAPNASSILPTRLTGAMNSVGVAGWLAGAAAYSYGATSVNFMLSPNTDLLVPTLGGTLGIERDRPLTVRVGYLAHCGIPIARYLMCDSSHSLNTGKNVDIATDIGHGDFTRAAAVSRRIRRSVPKMQQLSRGVGSHEILSALLFSGERFMVLHEDATLPLNSAPYAYKEKD